MHLSFHYMETQVKNQATLYWFTVQVVGLLKTESVNIKARATESGQTIKAMARVKKPGGLAYNIVAQEEVV